MYETRRPGRGLIRWAVLLLLLAMAVPTQAQSKPLKIVATTAMIGEPLTRIVGAHAQVETLMGEGVDPHLYRPTRSDIARLTRADAIIYNGLALEAQLLRPIDQLAARTPVLAVAEAIDAAARLPYEGGPGDPHIWMDPALWRDALAAAVDFLIRLDPDHAQAFRDNAARYFAELDTLQTYADETMGSIPENARILVTAHDAFSYFGARYSIKVRGILGISTESEAGLRAIEDLVTLIVTRKIRAVFVESSVSDRQVRALVDGAAARDWQVSVGGTLFSDAMGAAGTYRGTYIGMIDHNVTVIARALGGEAPADGAFGRLSPDGGSP
ncbi:MAG: metal ABC transporter solute-binding protein, Zn/Mn family [Alphaproteobacteria bacterium]